jgi:hypothetical protein
MKLNKSGHMQQVAVDENVLIVTAATTLRRDQRIVRASSSTAAYAVTLPNVSEAAGDVFTLIMDASAGGFAVTIQDQDESMFWEDIALNQAGDYAVIFSDGRSWRVLASNLNNSGATGIVERFESQPLAVQSDGTAASGVAGETNVLNMGSNVLELNVKGTQTILCPQIAATGLDVAMDQTADDGCEITDGITARSKSAFVVGTDACFARLTFSIADVSGTDDCAFGFRKAEAYQANIDDYDEMAVLNVISGDIYMETILNNAATTSTDTTNNWADLATHTLEVRVDKAGAVTYKIDGAAPTTVAAFSFDAGEVIVPFFFFLQHTDLCDTLILQRLEVGRL